MIQAQQFCCGIYEIQMPRREHCRVTIKEFYRYHGVNRTVIYCYLAAKTTELYAGTPRRESYWENFLRLRTGLSRHVLIPITPICRPQPLSMARLQFRHCKTRTPPKARQLLRGLQMVKISLLKHKPSRKELLSPLKRPPN